MTSVYVLQCRRTPVLVAAHDAKMRFGDLGSPRERIKDSQASAEHKLGFLESRDSGRDWSTSASDGVHKTAGAIGAALFSSRCDQ